MMYVPLERAQELLYKNGEMDPLLVALEIELYQRNGKSPGMYVGYLKSGHSVVETFSDAQEGAKYVAELKEMKNGEVKVDFVVVDGIKSG